MVKLNLIFAGLVFAALGISGLWRVRRHSVFICMDELIEVEQTSGHKRLMDLVGL